MKKTGIIGAMEEEVAFLKERMAIEKTEQIAGMEFCQGICEGHQVVVVRSGIGKMSCGWQFLWCLNPDYYNDNLKSIRTFLSLPDIIIYNEYGEKYTVDEFFDHIGPCLYMDDEHINAFCYERLHPTEFSRRDKEWTSEDGLRFTTGEFC